MAHSQPVRLLPLILAPEETLLRKSMTENHGQYRWTQMFDYSASTINRLWPIPRTKNNLGFSWISNLPVSHTNTLNKLATDSFMKKCNIIKPRCFFVFFLHLHQKAELLYKSLLLRAAWTHYSESSFALFKTLP